MQFEDPVEEWKWHVRRGLRPGGRSARSPLAPRVAVSLALVALGAMAVRVPGVALGAVAVVVARAALSGLRVLADTRAGVDALITRADAHLRKGEYRLCEAVARRGLALARVPEHRAELCKCLAHAAIALKDPFLAHGALLELPRDALDVDLVVSYLTCCNRIAEARALLDEARRA